MKFKVIFCDPFKLNIIDLSTIEKDEIINKFNSIAWQDYLNQMGKAHKSEIHYSPSLEIENTENKNGITISAVDSDRYSIEHYLFFNRPKLVSKFFGLIKKINNNYLTEITEQTKEDALLSDDIYKFSELGTVCRNGDVK